MFRINYWSHNWLVRKINNNKILENTSLYRGSLYDLGCGTQPYYEDIKPFVINYIGVDWGNTLHKKNMHIEADLNQALPIENAVADTVLCLQTLEHLSEPLMFLKEANRIMKTGANIMITVPFIWHVHEEPFDFFRYTNYGLKHLLTKANFKQIEIQAVSGFWVSWVLRFNYNTYRYSNKLGKWITIILIPIWFIGQIIAPLLDKYDKNNRDTIGYCATAIK